jgi:hypothetical protein
MLLKFLQLSVLEISFLNVIDGHYSKAVCKPRTPRSSVGYSSTGSRHDSRRPCGTHGHLLSKCVHVVCISGLVKGVGGRQSN